jgi:hypothetical protein
VGDDRDVPDVFAQRHGSRVASGCCGKAAGSRGGLRKEEPEKQVA